MIIKQNSLAQTLDNLNEVFFYNQPLRKADKQTAAKWLASRRGKAGSYAGMFAPTPKDFAQGVKVFTGEPVTSNAAIGHILGEEACRALIQLKVKTPEINRALKKATNGMLKRLYYDPTTPKLRGMYCCGICSASYWRHLVVGGLDHSEKRLVLGMKALKEHRKGNGEWNRFPFYYTLLALNEIKLKQALAEMQYAAPILEKYLKRATSKSKYTVRRRDLAERILAKC
ncbi:MAG: hypothetical protein KGZ86_01475 [Candidatus Latescibacteria bacterium]|nr:hypothetical protein [Candidatus Latescibacterota bacterium]